MGRKKKIENDIVQNANNNSNLNSNNSNNQTEEILEPNYSELDREEQQRIMKTYEQWTETFARQVDTIMHGMTMPPYWANSLLQQINVNPKIPSQADLKEYLRNPSQHEQSLRGLIQYLENAQMLFKRAIYHYANMFTFNYFVTPITYPEDKSEMKAFQNAYDRALDFLRKFRVKKQFRDTMLGIIEEDAKFYHIREQGDYVDLQEMPSDYCKINGKSSIGYSYSFNMAYFAQMGFTNSGYPVGYFAPEFEKWFDEFLETWRKQPNKATYYIDMPPELGVVFKFDNTKAGILPPLSGVLQDALEIDVYKSLLRTKSELDTWKVIFLETPTDNMGKPTMDAPLVAKFIAEVQKRLPSGVKAVSAPMEANSFNFDSAQTMNQIIGKGESQFMTNAGISSSIYGSDAKSAGVLQYSIQGDHNFISHMIRQFEDFLNYHLSRRTGKYQFQVKFLENDNTFNNKDNNEFYLKNAQFGGSKSAWLASTGLEPHQTRNLFKFENDFLGLHEELIPLVSSHTQNGNESLDNGAKKKSANEKKDETELKEQYH